MLEGEGVGCALRVPLRAGVRCMATVMFSHCVCIYRVVFIPFPLHVFSGSNLQPSNVIVSRLSCLHTMHVSMLVQSSFSLRPVVLHQFLYYADAHLLVGRRCFFRLLLFFRSKPLFLHNLLHHANTPQLL